MLTALKDWRLSRASRNFWATRERDNPAWVEGVWNGRKHPLRNRIATLLAGLEGSSLLEVGTHCGVNLWAVAQKKHYTDLRGVDISRHALAQGRALLAHHLKQPHELIEAPATKLPFPDRSFDAVLSSGMLLCLGNNDASKALAEIGRVARRHIVLVEPFPEKPGLDIYPNTTYWIRDYTPLLNASGFRVTKHERVPAEENLGHMNSVLTAKRA